MKAFLNKLRIRFASFLLLSARLCRPFPPPTAMAGSDALATDNIFQIALKMDMPSNITT